MKNLGQMMKQAQQVQAKMQDMQRQLEEMEVTGASAGGMVAVTMTGKNVVRKVRIDPSLVQPDDAEVLEDLILAAVNDANAKVKAAMEEKMAELTGGLHLPPGMSLPF